MQSPKVKYRALRMIAFFYRVVAYLVILIIIVTLLVTALWTFFPNFFNGINGPIYILPSYGPLFLAIIASVFGTIFPISLFAISEGILIFIDMANDLSKIKAEVTHNSDL